MNQQPREVKFKTKVALFKAKPIQAFLGAYLIGFSILFMSVGVLVTLTFMDRTVPNIDYEEIVKNGTLTKGKITKIENHTNISDNGQHPTTITYKYLANSQEFESKYQILSPETVNRMRVGDEIQIKYLNNVSLINGFKPYAFPVEIFALTPIPLLIIGILLTIPVVKRFRKDLNLYKYGKVHNAELVSMSPKFVLPISTFKHRLLVHYQYKTSNGQNFLGDSLTTDFSIFNQKKQGDFIKIFVSDEDESKSCYIPKLEAVRNSWNID